MYSTISTNKDVLRERYIIDAELVGKYDMPMLPKVTGNPELLTNAVVFKEAGKCKNPRESLCHFFTADEHFERVWNTPDKYMPMLENFKFVCTPDFTYYGDMPLALRLYQVYRARAIAWLMYQRGVNIIPTVGWNEPSSWEWCFDGLPKDSIVAVSTNGCRGRESEEHYRQGFHAMCQAIEPYKVVCVGRPIEVIDDVEIIYFDGFSQQLAKRLASGNKGLEKSKEK